MTEKLKYKVGDKVLVEAEVMGVLEGDDSPYRIHINGFYHWMDRKFVEQNDLNLPPKPKIPQAVMDWYEKHENERASWDIRDWLHGLDEFEETNDWALTGEVTDLDRQHALATLITYGSEAVEVEKEKRYLVTLKRTGQLLARTADGFFFGTNDPYFKDSQYEFTKQELIDAGFEGVFDNPMFEVVEVE